MENQTSNPYLPIIIDEIKSSLVYSHFLQALRRYGIEKIYDCHAHISSGQHDTIGEDTSDLLPKFPFSIADVNRLYDELFISEDIEFKSVIFDTPLPAYDLAKKNGQLLQALRAMNNQEMGKVIPFAVVTPEMDHSQIEDWVASGARGFKMTPRTASPHVKRGVISDISLIDMLNPKALSIADGYGLPLVVHLPQLVVSPRMKQSLKDELLQIADKYPSCKIILAHVGQAQTPAKIEDILALIEDNNLCENLWMDISAVTVPSVLARALDSKVRLLFGTDIDFALTERGKYIMFKTVSGQRILASDDERGNVMTALVSTSFGEQLKSFLDEQGIDLDAPLMLFQFNGILEAIKKLQEKNIAEDRLRNMLEGLFFRNAETLFGI